MTTLEWDNVVVIPYQVEYNTNIFMKGGIMNGVQTTQKSNIKSQK